MLLLVGAGLFVQTLRNLTRVDVGFVPDGLLQVSIDTRGAGYGPGQVGALQRRLLDRVAAIPGVRSVTAIRNGVMQSAGTRSRVTLPGRALGPDDAWNGAEVGPAFFETMAIPVLRGRAFTAADFAQGRRLVAVTEDWARRYFPGENPVGAVIGDAPQYEIVGVVADSRIFDLRTDVGPTMYFMAPPDPDRFNALEVRTAGNADAVAQTVQAQIRDINPRLLIGVRTMRQEIARSVARERLVAMTSTAFSLLGALLASIGIFGVAAATVAQRTTELGIRMALGAGRWTVVREALGETLQVFAAGLAAGLVARGDCRPCDSDSGRRSALRHHRDGHGDGGRRCAGDAAGRGGGVPPARPPRGLDRSPRGHPRSVVACSSHGPSRSGPQEDQGIQE